MSYDSFSNSVFESQVLGVTRRLRSVGIDVHLIIFELPVGERSPHAGQRQALAREQLGPDRVHILPKMPMLSDMTFSWAARQLGRQLLKLQAGRGDVLHCRGHYSGCLVRRPGVESLPALVDFRGVGHEELGKSLEGKGRIGRFLTARKIEIEVNIEQQAASSATRRTAVSGPLSNYLQQRYALDQMPAIVPCAYDESLFVRSEKQRKCLREAWGWTDENIVLAYAGSGRPWQNPGSIIRLYRDLHSLDPRFRFLILSHEESAFRALAAEAGLSAVTTVESLPHERVPAYLSAADVGVLLRDGSLMNRVSSPTKFPEYLACGLPVILSGVVGDANDLIRTRGVGWLADGMPVDTLQREISEHWQSRAARCAETAQSVYSWDVCLSSYIDDYTDLASTQ